jgi:hypothetical protein
MEHHLAQVNLAYMRAPQDDPLLGGGTPGVALWWVTKGHIPTPEEGKEKLRLLGRKGPSPAVFTFKQACTPQGKALER